MSSTSDRDSADTRRPCAKWIPNRRSWAALARAPRASRACSRRRRCLLETPSPALPRRRRESASFEGQESGYRSVPIREGQGTCGILVSADPLPQLTKSFPTGPTNRLVFDHLFKHNLLKCTRLAKCHQDLKLFLWQRPTIGGRRSATRGFRCGVGRASTSPDVGHRGCGGPWLGPPDTLCRTRGG